MTTTMRSLRRSPNAFSPARDRRPQPDLGVAWPHRTHLARHAPLRRRTLPAKRGGRRSPEARAVIHYLQTWHRAVALPRPAVKTRGSSDP